MKPLWHSTIVFPQNENTTPFTSDLNCYITHLTGAGPWGHWGCMGDPLDPGTNKWALKITSYNSVDHNYYKRVKANHLTNPLQQFTHRSLHSKLYTNFTHYLHFPHPMDLVVTWHHHFYFHWLLHTAGACCSSSSWLKTQNTRNVHIYALTSTNATHNSSHSSHIALLTYWSQSVLGIYK